VRANGNHTVSHCSPDLKSCTRPAGGSSTREKLMAGIWNRPITAGPIPTSVRIRLPLIQIALPLHFRPLHRFSVLNLFICSKLSSSRHQDSDAAAYQAQAKGCVSYSVLLPSPPFASSPRAKIPSSLSPIDWLYAPHLLEARWTTYCICISGVGASTSVTPYTACPFVLTLVTFPTHTQLSSPRPSATSLPNDVPVPQLPRQRRSRQ
jgi:hypothetical protein